MFTGIIQTIGEVLERVSSPSPPAPSPPEGRGGSLGPGPSASLVVTANSLGPDVQVGESIAVNGVCLTVASFDHGLRFDLSPETIERTTLGRLAAGGKVNLERALKVGDRLGGHFVQGHVDAVGRLASRREEQNSHVLSFEVPDGWERYLVDKCSICIDGISLTVVEPRGRAFDVWIVPHTLQETNLGSLQPGSEVNIEFDMLAKYVEKLVGNLPQSP